MALPRLCFSLTRTMGQSNGASRDAFITTVNEYLRLSSSVLTPLIAPSLQHGPISLHNAGQIMTFTTSPVSFWSPGSSKGHDGLKFAEQRKAKYQESYNGRWVMPLPDYQK